MIGIIPLFYSDTATSNHSITCTVRHGMEHVGSSWRADFDPAEFVISQGGKLIKSGGVLIAADYQYFFAFIATRPD